MFVLMALFFFLVGVFVENVDLNWPNEKEKENISKKKNEKRKNIMTCHLVRWEYISLLFIWKECEGCRLIVTVENEKPLRF